MTSGKVYRWRCAKCNNHFANIENVQGQIIIEKKCTKCKSINKLILLNKEIRIQCMMHDPNNRGHDLEVCNKTDHIDF